MKIKLRFTLLGTGTSQGVPVIGCACKVCQSDNPKDKRLRVSLMVESDQTRMVVDCGPDFREQMLRTGVDRLDAILFTHEHADHVAGLDDVRPFNFRSRKNMPLYATNRVADNLRERFGYAFETDPYPGAPRLQLMPIEKDRPFLINRIRVTPIELMHGKLPVLGFRIGNVAYMTDMNHIEPDEFEKIKDLDVLIVDALHHYPHHSHFTIEQAIDFAQKVNAKQTYFTHMSHSAGLHDELSEQLPEGIALGYDGLSFEVTHDLRY